jgi:crotonobetainyl-CoA:carnitine CoA-transferase CaiB-like acyl-CoA transferase
MSDSDRRLLSGIRILDVTEFLAGPYCTWILAQLGAEVIKIERPDGDAMRRRSLGSGMEPIPFHMVHGNKKSMVVDLKTETGQAVVRRLAAVSDVFVENFRRGVVERLRLDERTLRADHPELIYCSIRGFREGTDLQDATGVDLVAQAMGGLASVTGTPDGPPVKAGFPIGDFGGGMWAALGILAAYVAREKTGEGDYVRAALVDGIMSWSAWDAAYYLMTGEDQSRRGSAHLYLSPFEFFECSDEKYIAIGVGSDHHWQTFCEAIQRPELANDPRFRELYERGRRAAEVRAEISPVLRSRPSSKWIEVLDAAGIPCGPILNTREVVESRYAEQARMIVSVDGFQNPIRVLGFPVQFTSHETVPPHGGPGLGTDTSSVMKSAGFSDEEVRALVSDGVIGTGSPARQESVSGDA